MGLDRQPPTHSPFRRPKMLYIEEMKKPAILPRSVIVIGMIGLAVLTIVVILASYQFRGPIMVGN